ncbi:replication-associated protein [robinz virus RP_369]|nr:replication-associated protein [robinz virus RP_369]
MPSFICNARYFLVTYPQCGDLDGFHVMECFSRLGAECIIGREHHEDGGLHLHCFADFGRKFRSRKADIFDVDGRHPNIAASKGTPEKGYDYAIKDGDVVCGGLGRPEPSRGRDGSSVDKWTQITSATSPDEFWDLCHQLDPKSTACSFGQLAKYCDWRFRPEVPEYEHPGGIELTKGDVDGRDECRRLSLILYGDSRTGKTLWARSLGSHIYTIGLVSGTELMRAASADYAVFDDIRGGIKFFPAFKEWLGCQEYVTVKQLYKDPTLVKWGKPSIWIANDDPRLVMEAGDVSWLEANCTFIEICSPIFHANTE